MMRLPACILVIVLLGWTARLCSAQTIYATDFDGDQLSEQLVFTEGGMGAVKLGAGELRVQRDEATNNGRIRLVYDHFGQSLADYTVTTHFRRGKGGGWTGLVVRTNTQDVHAAGYVGYHARLRVSGDSQVFELVRLGGVGGTKVLSSQVLKADQAYHDSATWTMSMTAIGSSIQARLVNEHGDQVSQLKVDDTNFPTGTAALRAEAGAVTVYESFRIETVDQEASSGAG